MGQEMQIFINIGFSLFGALLGIIVTIIFKRIGDLAKQHSKHIDKHTDLSVHVAKNYVAKDDFNHLIDRIFKKLDTIESKIDNKEDKGH